MELVRDRFGLERVGLYTCEREEGNFVMRGSWGTGLSGETLDERGCCHWLSSSHGDALRMLRSSGSYWIYRDRAPYVVDRQVVGHGWLAVTPLVAAGDLVGVMYNDAALTQRPLDADKQRMASLFCGLLAGLLSFRQATGFAVERTLRSPAVQLALHRLESDPMVTGEQLAQELRVSAGYLSRAFKREVGVSLVEYRNQLRVRRFLTSVDRERPNLLRAALEAGFGSYAQFHRVYRRLFGTTPREHFADARRLP
jgi:AraC-like DNA-binding protein